MIITLLTLPGISCIIYILLSWGIPYYRYCKYDKTDIEKDLNSDNTDLVERGRRRQYWLPTNFGFPPGSLS